jgi:hypothetical protein
LAKPKGNKKKETGKEDKTLATMVQEKNRIRNLRNMAQGSAREELHQQYTESRNKVKKWIKGTRDRKVSEVNGKILNLRFWGRWKDYWKVLMNFVGIGKEKVTLPKQLVYGNQSYAAADVSEVWRTVFQEFCRLRGSELRMEIPTESRESGVTQA